MNMGDSSNGLGSPGQSSTLCESCASIDLYSALAVKEQSFKTKDLGNVDSPEANWCPLCRLFSSFKYTDEAGDHRKPYSLYVHTVTDPEIWGRNGSVLVVSQEGSEDGLDYCLTFKGAIACTSGPPNALTARIIPKEVNFEHLRHLMSLCMKYHKKCARYTSQAATPKNLKLIDCESREIVQNRSNKYVALSYVWGLDTSNSGYEDGPKEGKLRDKLPQTIEDAITATKKLNYRYLWIDRYCIDQSNDAEKHDQIWQMNTIYRNARVTIVAAAGKDPHFGLPGVNKTHRKSQPSARIGGTDFVSILPHPDIAVSESRWSGRGWTYQEGYFSIRLLYFLEDQVYFRCYNAAATETISHLDENRTPYAITDTDDGEQDAHKILDHLCQYSGRTLTWGSDAVNAVAGVFNDYGNKYGITSHHLGVPIVRYSKFDRFVPEGQRRGATNAFLIGLSWLNLQPGERRNIWPSWTWAAWTVPFNYGFSWPGSFGDNFTLGTDFVRQPRAFVEMKNGRCLDFEAKATLDMINKAQKDLSKFIHIESWTFALDINQRSPDESDAFVDVPLRPERTSKEYYACLKNEDVNFKIPFWPVDQDFTIGCGGEGEILGVVLSRAILGHPKWCLILMVVQSNGTYFERVGQCAVIDHQMRELAKGCGGHVESDWVFGWKRFRETTERLCAKRMRRRSMRIG